MTTGTNNTHRNTQTSGNIKNDTWISVDKYTHFTVKESIVSPRDEAKEIAEEKDFYSKKFA